MTRNNLYIEKYTLAVLLKVMFSRKRVARIFILDSVDFYEHNPNEKNLLEKISIKLFKYTEIIRLPLYEQGPVAKDRKNICWQANKKTLEFLDSKHFHNKANILIKPLINFHGDEHIILAIKKMLMPYVFQKFLFYLQLQELQEATDKEIDIIVCETDVLEIDKYLELNMPTKRQSKLGSLFSSMSNILGVSFLILVSPLLMRDIFSRGVRVRKIKKQLFDTAIHLTWGFNTLEVIEADKMKKRNFGDDQYFKYGFLNPKQTIFVQGRWKFSSKIEDSFKRKIKSLGSSYVRDSELKVPLKMLLHEYLYIGCIKPIIKVGSLLLQGVKVSQKILFAIQKVHLSYLHHMLFCKYYKAKVFVSRDDYDKDHILRTVVQDKYSLINVGIQHSAFVKPELIPFAAHTYFHRYYLAGDGFKKLWHPYWDTNKSMKSVGPHRDHCIVEARENLEVKERFTHKYKKQITVLLLFSSPDNEMSPAWLLKKKYQGIHKLTEIDPRIHLILRPRHYHSVQPLLGMFPELNDCIESKTVTIELDDFTTQELIAYVDVCIAEDGSSVIIEAAHLEDLFLVSLNVRYPSFELQQEIVAEDMSELIDMIAAFVANKDHTKIKKAQNTIKNNFTVQPPGKTWLRISQDIQTEYLDTQITN